MKNKLFILFILLILQSCKEKPKVDASSEMIQKVEMGLTTPVYIKGDSTWTIEDRMAHYGVPGVSIAVINKGKIEWAKAYGVMDKEGKSPITEKTLFQSASISKPVTAYGALTLVEQKKVALEENINTYLKSWKLPDNEFTEEKKVTTKNLLNHSAGITVHGFLGYRPGLPVPTLIEVLNGTPPANSDASVVDKSPEESYRYSGGGYNIIQQMMIDVESKPFPEIMKELVLQPLEMNNSTYNQPLEGEQLEMAATGYLPDGSMVIGKRHTYPEMAPAGLWTTATDLAKYLINIQEALKGKSEKGLSKDMTAKMLTPFVEEFVGLGIFLNKKKDEIYFGHSGWNEGFSSQMLAHKEKGYGVVVLTNSNHPPFISEVIRAVARSYEWDDYVQEYQKKNIDTATVAKISGRYLIDGNRRIAVYEDNDKLFGKEIASDPTELVKISDSTYARRDSERLFKFVTDAEGKLNLEVLDAGNSTADLSLAKMDKDEKLPLEILVEGNFDESLKAYQLLKNKDANNPTINENRLNGLGYHYMGSENLKLAQDVFKINMMLYPESFNVYDSYAEVCMNLGETEAAVKNYNKSLELNPENTNAIEMLKQLESK